MVREAERFLLITTYPSENDEDEIRAIEEQQIGLEAVLWKLADDKETRDKEFVWRLVRLDGEVKEEMLLSDFVSSRYQK